MVAFFCRFCLNDKKLPPWALNNQKISHFTENDRKKVPWAVVYQNDGLRWISPGRRRVDDMCYDRRRAEACVDESAHHALANAGGREIVGKKEGEQKGSARGSVHWGCYYATALDIEVDPQRCGLGSCQSDFALQAVVECRALEPECFRVDILR